MSSLIPAAPFSLPGIAMLEAGTETSSQTQAPEDIRVILKVSSVLPPYKHSIPVPAGSSLEDVLKKAQKLGGFR